MPVIASATTPWDGDWFGRALARVASRLPDTLRHLEAIRRIAQQGPQEPPKGRQPGGYGAGSKGKGPSAQPSQKPVPGKAKWTPQPYSSLALPGVRETAGNPTNNEEMWDAKNQRSRPFGEMKHERGNFIDSIGDDELNASPDDAEEYYATVDPTYSEGLQQPGNRKVDLPEGLQPTEYSGADVDKVGSRGQQNIEKVLALATPQEMQYWSSWYKIAHRTAAQLAVKYKVSLQKASAVLAVLSPQEEWLNNVQLADRALAKDWANVNTLVPSREKAYSIVMNNDMSAIRGPKVYPFFLSIYNPEQFQDLIVADTHAAAIWMGVRQGTVDSISDAARAKMNEDYAKAGKKYGLTAREAQAVSWVVWRMIPVQG